MLKIVTTFVQHCNKSYDMVISYDPYDMDFDIDMDHISLLLYDDQVFRRTEKKVFCNKI